MRNRLTCAVPLMLLANVALAGERATPAAEIVVTVTDHGTLVGVGEPPSLDRLGVLVYVAGGGEDVAATVHELALALAGSPTVCRFATATTPLDALDATDAVLAGTGLPTTGVLVSTTAEDPGAQMTVDAGGYHRRDALGRAAADATAAVETFTQVASYGHGHTEPLFEAIADGGMRQVRTKDWDQSIRAYACPFPATPGLRGPAGMALELKLAEGRTASEEAFAGWCESLARALVSHCDATELLTAFDAGSVEVAYGDPPGPGLWWLLPDSAAPHGGSSLTVACAADALTAHHVAALHAGILLHIALVESDLTEGCRRVVEESCK